MSRVEMLMNMSSVKTFAKGEIVIREGEPDTEMYIILKGTAGVFKKFREPGQTNIAILSPGDFFGEMSLFLGRGRASTVVALEQLAALKIDRNNALVLFREQPELTFSMFVSMCQRVEQASSGKDAVTRLVEGVKLQVDDDAPAPTVTYASPAAQAVAAAIAARQSQNAAQNQSAAQNQVAAQTVAGLFPEGHGVYSLEMNTDKTKLFLEKEFTCPLCKKKFRDLTVRTTKLVSERTDPDMRTHYRDIEPLYFDVLTCPNCLYSALGEMFNKTKRDISEADSLLQPFRGALNVKIGAERDTNTVFAGYYLALMCTPVCFWSPELTCGKIWLKLSRVYNDAGDNKLELYAAEKALASYLYAYEKTDLSNQQSAQLTYQIGELYFQLGDFANAKRNFYNTKIDAFSSAVLKQRAENRLEEIKES